MEQNKFLVKLSDNNMKLLLDYFPFYVNAFDDEDLTIIAHLKVCKEIKHRTKSNKSLEIGEYLLIKGSVRKFVKLVGFGKRFKLNKVFNDKYKIFNLCNYEHNLIKNIKENNSSVKYNLTSDILTEKADEVEDIILDYLEGFIDSDDNRVEVFRDGDTILYYCKGYGTSDVGSIMIKERLIKDMLENSDYEDKDDYIKSFWNNVANDMPYIIDELQDRDMACVCFYPNDFWENVVEKLISNPSAIQTKAITFFLD